MTRTNWAGNYTYRAPAFREAGSVAEVQEAVATARQVRVLGSRHSFNDIADSDGVLLSLERMDAVLSLDEGARTVTVEGGIRYGALAAHLHGKGWALPNLASLPHISVAGAVATATHGSGSAVGNLATAVRALDVVTPWGDIRTFERGRDADFAGAVVALGALGPVVRLTLDIVPDFAIAQRVFTGLPFAALIDGFDAVMDAARSVSVFTDWRGDAAGSVWLKADADAADPGAEFHGATAAAGPTHPVPGQDGAVCTVQMGEAGPWHERLPHFRMGFTPSHGAEIQTEYFVPREEGPRLIEVMRTHGERLAPILMTSEIRTVAGDDLWLSPGHRGPYVGAHFTFRRDAEAVLAALPAIEADLAPLGVMPHWGKVFTMAPHTVRERYRRIGEFRALAEDTDPEGRFRNAFVRRMVFGAD
ncbi:FAD-binding protein [Wenxinia marina]|uniref:FAD/FMN-containing dehydrogenase n=1 Tax=Wenxinia marina DSM 24838 TaxID=1123501 RepID=A0A0D0NLE0_9RHOB|nr:FAD-binding protein [Wenxinia marina]KIQ69115.1 FAD/FMN-containing dehydrogenase [Wenxinia marina DSM 24838]GGL70375.1 xylitol oxidase [Wenxinia marina]